MARSRPDRPGRGVVLARRRDALPERARLRALRGPAARGAASALPRADANARRTPDSRVGPAVQARPHQPRVLPTEVRRGCPGEVRRTGRAASVAGRPDPRRRLATVNSGRASGGGQAGARVLPARASHGALRLNYRLPEMFTSSLTGGRRARPIPSWAALLARFYEPLGLSVPALDALKTDE